LPKSTQARSHGNNVCDVIIADAQINIYIYIYTKRCGKRKAILGPAGCGQSRLVKEYIAEMFVDYDKATHPVGESLSEEVRVH